MSFETSALLLSWVAILLLALVVAGLVRQVHALSGTGRATAAHPAPGPEPGAPAPGFGRLGPGLVLFLDRDCGVCDEVLAAAGTPLRAVFAGPAPRTVPADATVLAHESAGLFDDYRVPATPFAVVLTEDGRVSAAAPVGSPESLRELLEPELEVGR
ncbi:hypothetical protein [Actinomadura rupiterrae]|uniref:hypothetical protein n=1 Tax=Actinomadura rupiterrae TaxID=559627 RepID=UPI0020A453A0|nr:hypothetical protein [Actinomadura rupiterrae]MCP2335832.1 hypothetical protein [Actinomadura rupiterrae]